MRIGVTLGDPAGIGPEVVATALSQWFDLDAPVGVEVILYGPGNVADALVAGLGRGGPPRGALSRKVSVVAGEPFTGPMAQASAAGGRAALAALMAAIGAAQAKQIDALVTAPINKQALSLAGSDDLGHTEILGRHLACGPYGMAFFTPTLQVMLASVHVPLQAAIANLNPTRVLEVTCLLHQALLPAHPKGPRLALAGLNPHASEGGLMGDEEARLLMPAVLAARAQGINLSAPQAPDTVFLRAHEGEFDGVVALYHDQGLIPVKLLAFGRAVNVTLGLAVPRTSPDHGTAFDRVGKGTARADGMLAALQAAARLAHKTA